MQQNPAEALREIDQVRNRTHNVLRHSSFPCMLFGALMLAGALISGLAGGLAGGIFWAVAGPVAGAATAIHYQRREHRLGVETNPMPWFATGLGVLIGCVVTGFGGAALELPAVSTLGPLLCIAAGYLVFGRVAGSLSLSISAVVLAAAVVALWLSGVDPDPLATTGNAAYGVVTFAIGLVNRRHEVRSL
ncbi:MAG TPA: hypothetical protein VHL54_13740 [Actinomycetota bacterium]|nr:hypothetical protein [Actinomycetota bacterium]